MSTDKKFEKFAKKPVKADDVEEAPEEEASKEPGKKVNPLMAWIKQKKGTK
jgi:hypothetical protein